MTIGIDVDGVLRDMVTGLQRQYTRDYPDHVMLPVTEWGLEKFFPIGDGIWDYLFKERAYEIFEQGSPEISGGFSMMARLRSMGHSLIIVTKQPSGNEKFTLAWLEKHSAPFDGFCVVPHKGLLRLDVMLDDYEKNLKQVAAVGTVAVCFDQPWNQAWQGKRVHTHKEFTDFILWSEKVMRELEKETNLPV